MPRHVGLIGGGNISQTHARAALAIPNVAIAAIYGTNMQNIERLARDNGGKAFIDYNAFLAHRPMDLVMIGSPSGLHAQQGIDAAHRGIHVLTEKPIDITAARADELIAATRQANVKLGVMFQDRVKPDIRRLKHLVDSGALGKILFVDARVKWYRPPEYYGKSKWRGTLALDGGGALMNQGVHTVDLLLWVLGDVARVQSRTATALHPIESEDTAAAILEFGSGVLGTLHATTAAYPGYQRRVEITGTEGTVILEHDRIIATDLRNPPVVAEHEAPKDTNLSASSAAVTDIRGHQAILEDFLRAIDTDGTPICDGIEGRKSVALIEAIYRASKSTATTVA
ncbi:MAG TPA: Gfo/Idh/MocA family oxidoreductase [Candidatus Acidoferrum sp.]|jgi:predicted dehydrogenase